MKVLFLISVLFSCAPIKREAHLETLASHYIDWVEREGLAQYQTIIPMELEWVGDFPSHPGRIGECHVFPQTSPEHGMKYGLVRLHKNLTGYQLLATVYHEMTHCMFDYDHDDPGHIMSPTIHPDAFKGTWEEELTRLKGIIREHGEDRLKGKIDPLKTK